MSELIAVSFPDRFRADELRVSLLRKHREHVVDLEDAAVVVRDQDGRIKLNQMHQLTVTGAVQGGFWGLLIGALFLNPLLGGGVGAAAGAVSGALSDIGVDDRFMKELGASLPNDSSALFLLIRNGDPDRIIETLEPYQGTVLRTSLSRIDEGRLRGALETVQMDDVRNA